jgi:hypothetical protein
MVTLLLLIAALSGIYAGGPWLVLPGGPPMRWAAPYSVNFDVDAGGLGNLSHGVALARFQEGLAAWDAVGPVDLNIDGAHPLLDINATGFGDTNPAHYSNYWNKEDALPWGDAVKVIFDGNGAIINDLYGEGASEDILGLAIIDTPSSSGSTIHEASIIISGASLNGIPPDLSSDAELRGIMIHEIGHVLNLGHSALNHELAGDGDASNDRYIPTMFPLVLDSVAELAALKPDDTAALKDLYGGGTNSIQGTVRFQGAWFQGAQVTVRRTDPSPPAPADAFLAQAFSSLSGYQYIPPLSPPVPCDPPAACPEGLWRIADLPAGQYQVCVEQIDTSFSYANGSLVGLLVTPPVVPGPEECWDVLESGAATDDPDAASPVPVSGAVGGINFFLNGSPASDPGDVGGGNNTLGTATPLGPALVDTTHGLLGTGDLDFFSIQVLSGDRLRIDVDAQELGYPIDPVVSLWNPSSSLLAVADDSVDGDSARLSLDPWLEQVVNFSGLAKIGVSCYPDTAFTGCPAGTGLPYWLRVQVRRDSDGDGIVDSSDVCPNDRFNDLDRDNTCVSQGDHCPLQPGFGTASDTDADGIALECDVCPNLYNPGQENEDQDALGNVCDSCTDTDSDGFGDPGFVMNTCTTDNCPSFPNPSQANADAGGGDTLGNACDPCPTDPTNTCLDVTAPSVIFTLPANGQTNVSTSSDVLIYLSEDPDPDSVSGSSVFLVNQATGTKVSAAVRLSEGGVITLDPDAGLATGVSYTIRVRPPLRDLSGNEIGTVTPRTFTTWTSDDLTDAGSLGGAAPGGATGDDAGYSVTLLGDMNGDGFDEYAFGSPGAETGPTMNAGRVTLVLGSASALSGGMPTKIEFRGSVTNQGVGSSVADAGDLDGDGLHDIAFAAPQPASGTGKIWVVFGSAGWSTFPTGSTTIVNLGTSTLSNCAPPPPPTNDYFCGVIFQGNPLDSPGASLSRTADVGSPAPPPAHDGTGELLIGAPGTDIGGLTDAGAAYLVYGSASLRGQTYNLTDIGITVPGVVFRGENAGDAAGASVSQWSSPDQGGIDDLVIGAPLADTVDRDGGTLTDAGYLYAIHPNAPLPAVTDLAWVGRLAPPSVAGVVFLGVATDAQLGRSATGAKVRGTGNPDLISAANGGVYVIDGEIPKQVSTDGSSSGRDDVGITTYLRRIGASDIFNDFVTTYFFQAEPSPLRPMVVGGGGDLNGDGMEDFLIGDPTAQSGAGRVYVVYGRPAGWPDQVALDDIGTFIPGLRIDASPQQGGNAPHIEPDIAGSILTLGRRVDSGGDVNGDCLDEAIVGAPGGGNGNVFVFDTVAPPPVSLDADGDGSTACLDCDDTNPLVYPGNPEACDGFDNNCNGIVDDVPGAPDADSDGFNGCVDCNDTLAIVHPGHPEVCDGFDNDCNGSVDDTGDADGDGYFTCTDCNDANFSIHPGQPDTCDGLDNDCDGLTDEVADLGTTTCGQGVCNHTVNNCIGGVPQTCNPTQGASSETCDSLDNDCDGLTDEVADLGTTTCGQGVCNHTVDNCVGGVPQTCNPTQGASSETCDSLDNDCDGSTDEVADLGTTTCGLGVCNHTVDNCVGGVPQTCNPLQGASPEICDGLDNDCDGLTNEDGDGDGVGVCADCNDLSSGSFSTPGEVLNLRFTSATALAWDPPASPGGSGIRYDTLRADSPGGFTSAGTCVESDDGSNTQATDASTPALGGVFFYLLRGENDCPSGQGTLGTNSAGTPRSGRNCP